MPFELNAHWYVYAMYVCYVYAMYISTCYHGIKVFLYIQHNKVLQ